MATDVLVDVTASDEDLQRAVDTGASASIIGSANRWPQHLGVQRALCGYCVRCATSGSAAAAASIAPGAKTVARLVAAFPESPEILAARPRSQTSLHSSPRSRASPAPGAIALTRPVPRPSPPPRQAACAALSAMLSSGATQEVVLKTCMDEALTRSLLQSTRALVAHTAFLARPGPGLHLFTHTTRPVSRPAPCD